MGAPPSAQEIYYERFWNKIEVCTKYDVSSFMRDYLSIKTSSIPPKRKVYAAFKEFMRTNDMTLEAMLEDMLEYARRYEVLIGGDIDNKTLQSCIYRLNRLETTVTRPFFMEVLRLREEGKLTDLEINKIFLMSESYIFRRTMCDLPTNALNKIFASLHKEIIRYELNDDDYLNKFAYCLISKRGTQRFPDDDEFYVSFSDKHVYNMNAKNKIYILERFENAGTKEDKDVYRHFDEGDYSIEHIMPQTLSTDWKAALGVNYEEVHTNWCDRIANLTLTAYNSKYSNRSFNEKKHMDNGFLQSGIRLNVLISQNDEWTEKELSQRDNVLMKNALQIWEFPRTTFSPIEKQIESATLNEDADEFARKKIVKFSFQGAETQASSWKEMFVDVLQSLFSKDKTHIVKLSASTTMEYSNYFNYGVGTFRAPVEIGDGLYVETNSNTEKKLEVLKYLFKFHEIEPEELSFYF